MPPCGWMVTDSLSIFKTHCGTNVRSRSFTCQEACHGSSKTRSRRDHQTITAFFNHYVNVLDMFESDLSSQTWNDQVRNFLQFSEVLQAVRFLCKQLMEFLPAWTSRILLQPTARHHLQFASRISIRCH